MYDGQRAIRCSLLLCTMLSGPAFAQGAAQNPAPSGPHQTIDASGVELSSGRVDVPLASALIGSGTLGGFLYQRRQSNDGWRDSFDGRITSIGSQYTVSLGSFSERFTRSGNIFTSVEPGGATLTLSGTTFTYTRSNGDVVTLLAGLGADYYSGPTPSTANAGVSIYRFANGVQHTYSYKTVSFSPSQGAPLYNFNRIESLSSGVGYSLHVSYKMDSFTAADLQAGKLAFWKHRTEVALLAPGESCAHVGPSCQWTSRPSVTYGPGTYPGTLPNPYTITDAAGSVTTVTNSANGFAIRLPGSATDNLSYVIANGRVTQATIAGVATSYTSTDNAGTSERTVVSSRGSNNTTHIFELASGRLKKITNALSQSITYGYDGTGRLTSITRPDGDRTEFDVDARGNVTETRSIPKPSVGGMTIVTKAVYPPTCADTAVCNQPTATIDAELRQTDYSYAPGHGGVTRVTLPLPTAGAARPQTRYTYQVIGGVTLPASVSVCRTGASCAGAADETRRDEVYDARLNLTSATVRSGDGALSAQTSFTYDALGNVMTADGPLAGSGDVTRYRYDVVGRPVGVVGPDPDGAGVRKPAARRVVYDAAGRVTSDQSGSVASQSDGDWAGFAADLRADTSYDGYGRPVRSSLLSGGTTYGVTQYGYDALGRAECVAQRMDPSQWSAQTDACAAQTSASAGPDRIGRTGYDELDRVKTVTSAYGTAEASTDTTAYTANGQVASVTDGDNNRTAYTYDGHDRLVQVNYPVTTQGSQTANASDYEQYTLNAAGNVTQRRLRDGQVIGYAYDTLGRVVSKDRPNVAYWETDQSYAYDNVGHLTSASDSNGRVLTFGYDALGRRTAQGDNWYGFGNAWYQYDAAGRRTRLTWGDSAYVSYDYLVTGATSAIRDSAGTALVTFGYDDLGRRTSVSRANGTTTSYAYDPASRLSQLTQDLGGSAQDQTVTLAYNPAGQITSRTGSNDSYAWMGYYNVNRSYGVNGLNQMMSAGSTALGYDGRGNLTTSGNDTYTYTADNQMAIVPGTGLAHDPVGRLFNGMIDPGVNTTLTYDGADVIAETNQANGALLRRYVHGPGTDEPLIWYEGAGFADPRYLHADERGSVVAVTNSVGTALAINRYDEYGIPQAGNLGRFQYTGQKWLPAIGLYDYKVRIYSPTLGRFMQTDPIGYGDGLNWYNYVGGDPVNKTDPSGLCVRGTFDGKGLVMEPLYPGPCFGHSLPPERNPYAPGNSQPNPGSGGGSGRGNAPQSPKPGKPAYCSSFAYRLGDATETFGSTGKKFALGGMAAGAVTAVSGFGLGVLATSAKAYSIASNVQLGGQILKGLASGQPLTPSVVAGLVGQAILPTTGLGPIGQQSTSVVSDMVFSKTIDKVQPDRCK